MNAIDAILALLQEKLSLSPTHRIEVIRHPVGTNWRQQHTTAYSKILSLNEAMIQSGPFVGQRLEIRQLRGVLAKSDDRSDDRSAISITSRVWDPSENFAGHLALMNLHPSGFRSIKQISSAVQLATDGLHGYLLNSGRFFHYYGFSLLAEEDWINFVSQFLMPCVLVSPRYIGHSLFRRFTALRLNSVPPHKSTIPHLVAEI